MRIAGLYSQIESTGHSLGAVIAEVLGGTVTFENPGSKNICKQVIIQNRLDMGETSAEASIGANQYIAERAQKSVSYNADVNMINTCNEQLGKVFRLVDLPYSHLPASEMRIIQSLR